MNYQLIRNRCSNGNGTAVGKSLPAPWRQEPAGLQEADLDVASVNHGELRQVFATLGPGGGGGEGGLGLGVGWNKFRNISRALVCDTWVGATIDKVYNMR